MDRYTAANSGILSYLGLGGPTPELSQLFMLGCLGQGRVVAMSPSGPIPFPEERLRGLQPAFEQFRRRAETARSGRRIPKPIHQRSGLEDGCGKAQPVITMS